MAGAAAACHVIEVADDLDAAKPCRSLFSGTAQTFSFLTAAERDARRAAFVAVLSDGRRRGALAEVAKSWGKSTALVKRVRDGLAPLTDERIAALPPGLRAAVEARLAAPIQLRLPLL